MNQSRTNKFHVLKSDSEPMAQWRINLNDIIFGAESRLGKAFDIILIIAILLSVLAVILESIVSPSTQFGRSLYIIEWVFTLAFTIEYGLRLSCVRHPFKYVFSFYGLIDLLSIIPTYLSLFIPGANSLLVIRIFRILRVFRILKLFNYIREAETLAEAMVTGRRKIIVFLYFICTLVVVFGCFMYLIEGTDNGFTSIPRSIYWAIVTMTTVGYGDLTPTTAFGQMIASMMMIIGYAVIAVPTGIYTAELSKAIVRKRDVRGCIGCGKNGHEVESDYCRFCGEKLPE
jgi:voltage-gated potassium channel